MNIDSVRAFSTRVYQGAKSAGSHVVHTLAQIPNDKTVMSNVKKSLPAAAICAGGFSLLALLRNKKRDGKQGKIERNSGNFAQAAFAVASFKAFFKSNAPKKPLKEIIRSIPDISMVQVKKAIKTNKLNIIAYAAAIVGVKLVCNVATKLLDLGINKAKKPKKLGD